MEHFEHKTIILLHGEIKTPPLSTNARVEIGQLLRRLQNGEILSMPHSRPMPLIAARVHELRINDGDRTWRVIYRIDRTEIVIAEIFAKKTPQTPQQVIDSCQKRLKAYED